MVPSDLRFTRQKIYWRESEIICAEVYVFFPTFLNSFSSREINSTYMSSLQLSDLAVLPLRESTEEEEANRLSLVSLCDLSLIFLLAKMKREEH